MPEKSYLDERGWLYRVMSGISTPPVYKARYQKPGKSGWKCATQFEWRDTREEAQADLDRYAEKKGWTSL